MAATCSDCSYPPCLSSKKEGTMTFHRFPIGDMKRAMQWAINSNVPSLIELASQGPTKKLNNKRICGLHFERPSFNNDLKKSLTKMAIPTLFHPAYNTSSSNSCISSSSNPTETDANCKQIPITKNAEQSNSCTSKLSYTLAEVIAGTVGLDKHEYSQEYFYDDEDLSQVLSGTIPPENVEELYAAEIDLPGRDADSDANEDIQELNNNVGELIQNSTVASRTNNTSSRASLNKTTPKDMLCRLCTLVVPTEQMIDIFGKLIASKEYLRKMNQLLPPSEQPVNDGVLPQWICNVCCERLDYCDQAIHDFVAASVRINRLFSTNLGKKHESLAKEKNKPTSLPKGDGMQSDASVVLIKEESFQEEPFEEQLFNLFNYATNQEECKPNNANIQQEKGYKSTNIHQRRDPSIQKKDTKLCSSNSKFKCSQCRCTFLNKLSVFHHELTEHTLNITAHAGETTYEVIARKSQRTDNFDVSETLDSEDSFFLERNLFKNFHSAVEKIEEPLNNQLDSPSEEPSNPILIKLESGDCISSILKPSQGSDIKSGDCISILKPSQGSKIESGDRISIFKPSQGSVNKSNIPGFSRPSSPRAKKRRKASKQEEFEGKIIQRSHTTIPTASDNKTFLCPKCDISFHSIETALTHRFKEHAQEEMFHTGPK